ncbi:MAG: glycosyl hydrolase [Planctomycetota bacterium]
MAINLPNPDRRDFLTAAAAAAVVGTVPGISLAAPRRGRASRKKGFCTVVRDDGKWLKRITALKAKWFYSWGHTLPEGLPKRVEFCPMVWGAWGDSLTRDVAKLSKQIANDQIKNVMAFNEPDQHDQSNLSVERVLELWPKFMELEAPLASPGCVHPDREWMQQFMAGVKKRGYRVDYVCVHSYGGANAAAFMNRMQKVYKMYDRPLWITEFAVGDWKAKRVEDNRHSPQRVAEFMYKLLPAMERADFIDRYAWFSASQESAALGTSALFDKQGGLTPLGELYASA